MGLVPRSTRLLYSTMRATGTIELQLKTVPLARPGDDDVIVRIEAAPMNPSDLTLMLGSASLDRIERSKAGGDPMTRLHISKNVLALIGDRFDKPLPVGSEASGIVVETGRNQQQLVGRMVALAGHSMFAEYCCVPAASCFPMPDGTDRRLAAASFVNPLTVLCMIETMKMENHGAIINSAAASNLGRMLIRVCREDDIPLVSIVRRSHQADELRALGAQHVCVMDAPDFTGDLKEAIRSTGATLAFDAVGGGTLRSLRPSRFAPIASERTR